MNDICFAEFAKALKKAIQSPNTNIEICRLLLEWADELPEFSTSEGINITDSTASKILNRKEDLPSEFKAACSRENCIPVAAQYFKKNILPCLNPFVKDDFFKELAVAIETDLVISDKMKEKLLGYYVGYHTDEDVLPFVTLFFLYAVSRQNKLSPLTTDDIPLLDEVNYKCPMCKTMLLKNIKGQTSKNYSIISVSNQKKIQAQNLNDLLPLCKKCALTVSTNRTDEETESLKKLKEQSRQYYLAKENLDNSTLCEDIKLVLEHLGEARFEKNVELPLSPLRIDQKIPSQTALNNRVTFNVVSYYRFVNSLFSDLDRQKEARFKLIASEIKVAYEKLDMEGLPQETIVFFLTQWILDKCCLDEKYQTASDIIVSFFIQNCEVFHEIA